MQERRKYIRVNAELIVGIKPIDGSVFLPSKGIDISESGLKITTKEPIGIGKTLNIKLIYPHYGEIIDILAKVTWCKKNNKEDSYNIGTEIITSYPEKLDRLIKFKKISSK